MEDPVKKAQEKRRAERDQLQRARERVRAAKDARRADMERERKARDAEAKARREKDTKDEAVASIKDKPLVDPRDKAELYKLVTLALKQTPGSPKQKAMIKKINVLRKKNGMKPLKEEDIDESLWANIHKKRQRIKRGSGERMRKKGEKGAPTAAQMKRAKGESVTEDAKMAKLSDDKLRALLKKLQDFRKKEPKAPSTQFFIKRVEKEMKKRNLTEEIRSSQDTKPKKVGSIKSIKKNARSIPLSRDYILSNKGESKPMPMRLQMNAAMKMTNYDHSKYGSGFEIETKKGMVLIKPEVAELYMKSRSRLPDPIKKNMDRMAERSPDGLFTVLQAALNDLQTGMIESLIKSIE